MNWKNVILMVMVLTAAVMTFFMDVRPIIKVCNITLMIFAAVVLAEGIRKK